MEKVGMRGSFHKLNLAERPPHPDRANARSDPSPQAGRGKEAAPTSVRHHAERRKRVAGTIERDMSDPAILVHAVDQIVNRVELEFRPDPRDHRHIEGAAVKIACEI